MATKAKRAKTAKRRKLAKRGAAAGTAAAPARTKRKPRLTKDGVPLKKHASDAPRPLMALALVQVPVGVKGPAMKGAWARGWCDGVRLRKVGESNPYGEVGWMQPMRTTYVSGWRAGKRAARLEYESEGLSVREYQRLQVVQARAQAILAGEIASPDEAVEGLS